MRLVTSDDIIESYSKLRQKGMSFFVSKFNPNPVERTKGTFDHWQNEGAYWWQIPAVRHRWNQMVTGDMNQRYEDYFASKYLEGQTGLKLLSLGTGTCTHETIFAQMGNLFSEVRCVDVAATVLAKAQEKSLALGLTNMVFEVNDVNRMSLPEDYFDVVLFHSSLHHFPQVASLLEQKIVPALKPGGLLLLNEFVGPNRLQFPASQITAMNQALGLIPVHMRRRLKTSLVKSSVSGPGILRMLVADPSECVDSEGILPAVHRLFDILEETPYGGSLLMMVFKDIAHHFMADTPEVEQVLLSLFAAEDRYLRSAPSDFIFGVYRNRL